MYLPYINRKMKQGYLKFWMGYTGGLFLHQKQRKYPIQAL